tara:strand:+ start:567 stop:1892 length:1326 start_codon:yes stop_codon:yes gene_type:complete
MKILALDIYRNVDHRISKDTSGGYGTGNNFGDSFIPSYLKKKLKKIHDWSPMFLAYTISVLNQKGHKVVFSKELPKDYEDYDAYIIATSIVCCESEIEIIKKLSSIGKKVFAIGPFATNVPQVYVNAGAYVVSGEPEFFFLQTDNFLDNLNEKIITFNHDFDLDELPYPAWEQMIENPKNVSNLFGNYSTIPVLATRGCPYSCFKYCVYPLQQGRKVRQRNVSKIVDELQHWKNKMGISMFVFRDPVFSINKKHTIEFANELINRNINIKFIIETHLRILDGELIKLLKKAGLSAVKVGVESANKEVLKDANRFTIEKDDQFKKIRELEKNKIQVSAMFILGFPSDEEESMNKTILYAKKLNTTYAQFSVWTPYPGTPVFKEFEDKIIVKDYESFDQYNLIYRHKTLSPATVRKFLDKAYKKYYASPVWLFKFLKSFMLNA